MPASAGKLILLTSAENLILRTSAENLILLTSAENLILRFSAKKPLLDLCLQFLRPIRKLFVYALKTVPKLSFSKPCIKFKERFRNYRRQYCIFPPFPVGPSKLRVWDDPRKRVFFVFIFEYRLRASDFDIYI